MLYCRRKISYQEMKVSDLEEITQSVIEAVDNASNGIMKIYNSDVVYVKNKNDGSPVTEADKESHCILVSALEFIDKNIPILSEEGDKQKDNNDLFWLIDPLDGTKEFINRNGEFTVNIALIENNRPRFGVVHAPVQGVTYIGAHNLGAVRRDSRGERAIRCRSVRSVISNKDFLPGKGFGTTNNWILRACVANLPAADYSKISKNIASCIHDFVK